MKLILIWKKHKTESILIDEENIIFYYPFTYLKEIKAEIKTEKKLKCQYHI